MARTNAQKRASRLEAQRQHQAARRERLAAERKPDTSKVDAALVEALAFSVAATVTSAVRADGTRIVPSLRLITDTALAILVDRQQFDRRASKVAIGRRLKLRADHVEPSYIPSLNADPAAQAARIASMQTPPLLDQTLSSVAE